MQILCKAFTQPCLTDEPLHHERRQLNSVISVDCVFCSAYGKAANRFLPRHTGGGADSPARLGDETLRSRSQGFI